MASAAGPSSTTTLTTFAAEELELELEELLELAELLELDELLTVEELDELLTMEELDELLTIELDELLEYDEPLEPLLPQATKVAVARAKRENCMTRIGLTWACIVVWPV